MKRWLAGVVRLLIVVAVAAGLALAGGALLARKKAELSKAPQYDAGAMPVHVVVAKRGDLTEKRDYLSVVAPIRTATVSARNTATIEEVGCDEGDAVHAGDGEQLALTYREMMSAMERAYDLFL